MLVPVLVIVILIGRAFVRARAIARIRVITNVRVPVTMTSNVVIQQ